MALAEEGLDVPAAPHALTAVHASLERFWRALARAVPEPPDERWRGEFVLAVAEIAANIMRHAHPPEGASGRLTLRLRGFANGAEAHFADGGAPFTGSLPSEPPAPDGEPHIETLPEGGYGLGLVMRTVDRLEYSRTSSGLNRWRLFKRLKS